VPRKPFEIACARGAAQRAIEDMGKIEILNAIALVRRSSGRGSRKTLSDERRETAGGGGGADAAFQIRLKMG